MQYTIFAVSFGESFTTSASTDEFDLESSPEEIVKWLSSEKGVQFNSIDELFLIDGEDAHLIWSFDNDGALNEEELESSNDEDDKNESDVDEN